MITTPISVNGRNYDLPPRSVAVICLDGCAHEYLDAAMGRGLMPRLEALCPQTFRIMARGALPSFTNVNNVSIVTGQPPSVHGVGGNFFFDAVTKQEVMMNSGTYLRCETILAAAARAGRKVAMVTAKEKLRDLLARDLKGIAFSSEKASSAKVGTHGIEQVETLVGAPTPQIYSGEASIYVLKAGAALVRRGLADFLYLSLSDFIQHMYAPEAAGALEFYQALDQQIGALLDAGVLLGLTADHGMNAKHDPSGQPNIIYLEDEISARFGPGFRVILPITDPYVKHHGALGSFATIHLSDHSRLPELTEWLRQKPGITEVYDRELAAKKLELPADRIGDVVLLSGRNVVLGRRVQDHDLSGLDAPLRSHGGRYEEMVPLIISEPVHFAEGISTDPRNFDVFHFLLNGVAR